MVYKQEFPNISIKEYIYDIEQLSWCNSYLLDNMSLKYTTIDNERLFARQVNLLLKAALLSKETAEESHTFRYSYPKTWWQHFKQDVLPRWLLKKFPVELEEKSKTVTFKQRTYFPEADAPIFERGRKIYRVTKG